MIKSSLDDMGPLPNLMNLLGVVYHQQSKFALAERAFSQAFSAKETYVESGLNLVVTLLDTGRYDEAHVLFGKIQTASSKTPTLIMGRLANNHAAQGALYESIGHTPEALQEYRKALQLYPHMPDVRLKLGILYFRLGQFEKAKHEFHEIRESHEKTGALNWFGLLEWKNGNPVAARTLWETALLKKPNDSISLAFLSLTSSFSSDASPLGPSKAS